MKAVEVSSKFIDFYSRQGYSLLPMAPLLDPSIPMSFVMSAGLVQIEMASNQVRQWNGKQCVLIQKCFRHFDVQTVGTTNMHLSLFEMPAAFSFGSYNKAACVRQMWKLLTSALGCPKDNVWVTYFAGDEVSGHVFDKDVKVYQAWRDVGLLPERIIGLGADTNFWKQGDGISGMERYHKCASCTEAFFDRGSHLACGPDCGPGCHCGRFIELANSLFVDAEIDNKTNKLQPMEMPFVELVVGTERLAMILQGQESVFDIDSLVPLKIAIRESSQAEGIPPGIVSASEDILADHWRALFFLVADGAPPPGKNGRERIIKILVRGILTRQIILGIQSDFMPVMADTVVDVHQKSPKLAKARDTVLSYITRESERFMKTLTRGERQFERYLKSNGGNTLTGEQVAHLEKHKGVPSDLVEVWLLERGLSFDRPAYEDALHRWRLSANALH